MHTIRINLLLPFSIALLTLDLACVHRSPLWSPDGRSLIVLAGEREEEIDSAASQLWLVHMESRKTQRLDAPSAKTRFLSATWIDNEEFLVITGEWKKDHIVENTEAIWRRKVGVDTWTALEAPTPGGERSTRRLPIVIARGEEAALVYASGEDKVRVLSLASGKSMAEYEFAEIMGHGPAGGFLISRENDAGILEIVSIGGDLKERWKRKLSTLRAGIAEKTAAKSTSIVFNDTGSSHMPFGKEPRDWVGVVVYYSDVGWKQGFPGYYLRLDASDGSIRSVVSGTGLWGKPGSVKNRTWAILAPDKKKKIPVTLAAFDTANGNVARKFPLDRIEKENVQGYSIDPAGTRLAIALHIDAPSIVILQDDQQVITIPLVNTDE